MFFSPSHRFLRRVLATATASLASMLSAAAQTPAPTHTFAIGPTDFLLDDKPYVIRCGEIHFPRVPREYWEHRLKMAHAMGLNAVCVYLFWNYHEWEEGKFDWEGQKDAAEFCRLAQKEGLWVILRPGPYSCAEWEMGGLPWWLLKRDGIQLRTSDPKFMEPAARYLQEVGRVLGPLQITHGGPILMVQVENEYGSYGQDAGYMGALRQTMLDAGFNVPLFACNPPSDIPNGLRSDLFQVVNFGSGPEKAFDKLRQYQKTGPLMNGEFYPGWFDAWGRAHHKGDTGQYLTDLKYMLDHRHSFSIYMAHGGTTFGLWSGADRPFQPDTSSYDYDAPINEAGQATEKFTKTRELLSHYLQPGETLPDPPAANPAAVITRAPSNFLMTKVGRFPSVAARQGIADANPRTMEAYGQGRGCIEYVTRLPAGPAGSLSFQEVHDYGWVRIGSGKLLGVLDRRSKHYSVPVPARDGPLYISVLVEAVGRVNFGKEVADKKGIIAPVLLTPEDGGVPMELHDWMVYPVPLEEADVAKWTLAEWTTTERLPSTIVKCGVLDVEKVGDAFLDMRAWGKGVVWVNGHCLGRYWNIGPTQTMYLPGPWLKPGKNEVVILDLLPLDIHQSPFDMVGVLGHPILDELHPELDWSTHVRATGQFNSNGAVMAEGSFKPDVQWQEVKLSGGKDIALKGRYLCLESLNTYDKAGVTAVAEFSVFGPDGKDLPRSNWKILWASSEEATAEDGSAENAINGQSADHWHTAYSKGTTPFPHRLIIDLSEETALGGVRYLPRSGDANKPGRIKEYRIYVSDQPFGLTVAPD